MMALSYETFLRTAFGFAKNGEMVDRYGDPAQIADTDLFTESHLAGVKAGTAYGMEILSTAVINGLSGRLDEGEYARLRAFCARVIDAPDLVSVGHLITEYRSTVYDRYFISGDDGIRLR